MRHGVFAIVACLTALVACATQPPPAPVGTSAPGPGAIPEVSTDGTESTMAGNTHCEEGWNFHDVGAELNGCDQCFSHGCGLCKRRGARFVCGNRL